MAWRGSFTRSLASAARVSTSRSAPRLRTPPISAPRTSTRRSFATHRTLGALGCTQSFLPLVAGTRLTSHLTVNVRACCELYHGTFQRSCQDR